MKSQAILLLFCIGCLSCKDRPIEDKSNESIQIEFVYDYHRLKNAWRNRDSLYLKEWIFHLDGLNFESFTDKATSFATTGNFCYGYFDTEADVNLIYTARQKMALMFNVISVNKAYLSSCLFLNTKFTFDSTLFIQEEYWNDSTLFSEADILAIKSEMEKFCDK